jgi:hypothetical protein
MRGKARFVPVSAAFDVLINEGRIYNKRLNRPPACGRLLRLRADIASVTSWRGAGIPAPRCQVKSFRKLADLARLCGFDLGNPDFATEAVQ